MTCERPMAMLITAGLLAPALTGAAEQLRHDLFARPTLSALNVAPKESPTSSPPESWNPRLTALMVAGKSSLATIDGQILRIGEQADGYQLVSVADSEAVVMRDGQRYVLTMAAPSPVSIKNRGEE